MAKIESIKARPRSRINSLRGREILDSRGIPTVEVNLETDFGNFLSSVPSGVSTGKYEAVELRDEDGRGVKKTIENIERVIIPVLNKEDLSDQKRVDEILIQLDGTKNKSRLGANAILAVSIAVCRAIAKSKKLPLYQYISELAKIVTPKVLPRPSFNMIEGGKHAKYGPAFQEFMIVPQKRSFKDNFEEGKRVYKKLNKLLKKEFKNIKFSDEGAFSAPIDVYKALNIILEAGYEGNVGSYAYGTSNQIAIDAAASEFFENGNYNFEGKIVLREELMEIYGDLIKRYPVISIEDPFYEEDFESFAELEKEIGDRVIIFGDDLTVSNIERIKMAQERNSCSGLILKPNQIGTVTETLEAAKLAKSYGWKIMVANRAGETEDDFIADLAVGIGADFIKSGAPFPKERMAKYNRLVKIEEELNN